MGREIKNLTTDTTQQTNRSNDYKDRLVKLIPSEIVTAYITIQGLIIGYNGLNKSTYALIAFLTLLILTPFYLKSVSNVTKVAQIIFTTLAFVVWVLAMGGFKLMFPMQADFFSEFFGSIILIIYTLMIPLVYKG